MDRKDTDRIDFEDFSFDAFDEARDPRPQTTDFDRVVETAISRRGLLGVLAIGSGAAAMGLGVTGLGSLMSSTSWQNSSKKARSMCSLLSNDLIATSSPL